MRLPLDIKHIIATDYFGQEYIKAVEDIPVKPTRAELWAAWRDTQAVNEAFKAAYQREGQHGSINETAVNNHFENELL
jgi:hypothetical protein